MTSEILVLIEQIFEKIEALEKKFTNQYKRYQSVLKRIKVLENER